MYIHLYFSQDLATLPNDLNHGDNYLPHDDRLSTHRNSAGYSFDGLPKLSNASGGGTKSQASTASSSATRDSGISVTDAQRAADENRCTYLSVFTWLEGWNTNQTIKSQLMGNVIQGKTCLNRNDQ